MSLTPSNMIELGTTAPDFTLPNTIDGKMVSLKNARGKKGTVIMFICNHCPFVKHIENKLASIPDDFTKHDIAFIAISANDVENYPEDAPDKMKTFAEENGFNFPYLYDKTQATAKAYDAACTPDFFIFDDALKCVYRGQFDDSRPGNNTPVTGNDLRAALTAIADGKPVSTEQKPSIGCNIKWKNT